MHDDNLAERFPNAIALTGGIASGKSTVCSLLLLNGFTIIDADKISREVMAANQQAIIALFGEDIQAADGTIDRAKLGARIFADPAERKKLEHFMHPKIKEAILERCTKQERFNVPYIVDIPLLFETNNYNFKRSVLVYTPRDIQLKRLVDREGYSDIEAAGRLDAQLPIDDKRAMATYVIDNTHTLKDLQQEVEMFTQQIKSEHFG
jgi:dephospho-CoA kinase